MDNHFKHLTKDLVHIIFSIIIAVVLVQTGAIRELLVSVGGFGIWGSIIAGVFFTSILTTAPAIVGLAAIAEATNEPLQTAFFGAIGAVLGDLILFHFIKDTIIEDFKYMLGKDFKGRLKHLYKNKFFKGVLFLVGGLIIASPLPDELGITLLGITRINIFLFIPISFTFNFLGILLIGLIAN